MISLYQERDFGSKINATFQYITQNFRSYALAILFIAGPPALVIVMTGVYLFSSFSSTSSNQTIDPGLYEGAVPAFFLIFGAFMLTILMAVLVTLSHMKVYATNGGRPISTDAVWAEVRKHILSASFFIILSTVISQIGGLLIIPGIYLNVVFALGVPILVFEDASFSDVWGRCFTLIRDKWFSTFGLVIVMSIIGMILFAGLMIPSMLIVSVGIKFGQYGLLGILLGTVTLLGSLLIVGLYYSAIGFQYTNLAERQEGHGLIATIDSIGSTPVKPQLDDEGEY